MDTVEPEDLKESRVAQLYTKVRSGKVFFIGLTLFCGFWVLWNLLPGLPRFDDPGLGRLTVILSIEASIATSMLIVANERQEAFQKKQMLYIQHLMEAQHDALQAFLAKEQSDKTAVIPVQAKRSDPTLG